MQRITSVKDLDNYLNRLKKDKNTTIDFENAINLLADDCNFIKYSHFKDISNKLSNNLEAEQVINWIEKYRNLQAIMERNKSFFTSRINIDDVILIVLPKLKNDLTFDEVKNLIETIESSKHAKELVDISENLKAKSSDLGKVAKNYFSEKNESGKQRFVKEIKQLIYAEKIYLNEIQSVLKRISRVNESVKSNCENFLTKIDEIDEIINEKNLSQQKFNDLINKTNDLNQLIENSQPIKTLSKRNPDFQFVYDLLENLINKMQPKEEDLTYFFKIAIEDNIIMDWKLFRSIVERIKNFNFTLLVKFYVELFGKSEDPKAFIEKFDTKNIIGVLDIIKMIFSRGNSGIILTILNNFFDQHEKKNWDAFDSKMFEGIANGFAYLIKEIKLYKYEDKNFIYLPSEISFWNGINFEENGLSAKAVGSLFEKMEVRNVKLPPALMFIFTFILKERFEEKFVNYFKKNYYAEFNFKDISVIEPYQFLFLIKYPQLFSEEILDGFVNLSTSFITGISGKGTVCHYFVAFNNEIYVRITKNFLRFSEVKPLLKKIIDKEKLSLWQHFFDIVISDSDELKNFLDTNQKSLERQEMEVVEQREEENIGSAESQKFGIKTENFEEILADEADENERKKVTDIKKGNEGNAEQLQPEVTAQTEVDEKQVRNMDNADDAKKLINNEEAKNVDEANHESEKEKENKEQKQEIEERIKLESEIIVVLPNDFKLNDINGREQVITGCAIFNLDDGNKLIKENSLWVNLKNNNGKNFAEFSNGEGKISLNKENNIGIRFLYRDGKKQLLYIGKHENILPIEIKDFVPNSDKAYEIIVDSENGLPKVVESVFKDKSDIKSFDEEIMEIKRKRREEVEAKRKILIHMPAVMQFNKDKISSISYINRDDERKNFPFVENEVVTIENFKTQDGTFNIIYNRNDRNNIGNCVVEIDSLFAENNNSDEANLYLDSIGRIDKKKTYGKSDAIQSVTLRIPKDSKFDTIYFWDEESEKTSFNHLSFNLIKKGEMLEVTIPNVNLKNEKIKYQLFGDSTYGNGRNRTEEISVPLNDYGSNDDVILILNNSGELEKITTLEKEEEEHERHEQEERKRQKQIQKEKDKLLFEKNKGKKLSRSSSVELFIKKGLIEEKSENKEETKEEEEIDYKKMMILFGGLALFFLVLTLTISILTFGTGTIPMLLSTLIYNSIIYNSIFGALTAGLGVGFFTFTALFLKNFVSYFRSKSGKSLEVLNESENSLPDKSESKSNEDVPKKEMNLSKSVGDFSDISKQIDREKPQTVSENFKSTEVDKT